MQFAVVVALDINEVIGVEYTEMDSKQNSLCLYNRIDRAQVKRITTCSKTGQKNLIIVGRKTYETFPETVKKCPFRDFVVLSRSAQTASNHKRSVKEVIEYCISKREEYDTCFIFGGKQVYDSFMTETNLVTKLYVSTIHSEQHFPQTTSIVHPVVFHLSRYLPLFTLKKKNQIAGEVDFCYYKRTYLPYELQYVKLMREIQCSDKRMEARHRMVKTLDSGYTLIYDLSDGFPISTLRRGFPRGIFTEFIWMIQGSTDVNVLKNQNVHIWDKHSSQNYFQEAGISHLKENDIGPGYGFQLLHWGAKYIDCKTDYTGQGINQLERVVKQILNVKKDPTCADARRIIINLWNVKDVDQMALPCCHYSYQFTVRDGKMLDGSLMQRSWDVTLGWNDSTLACFIHFLAHFCDLEPGIATHFSHNVHTDKAHEQQIQEFINGAPFLLPKLQIVGEKPSHISGYTVDQFQLSNYQYGPAIKMELQ